MDSKLNQYLKYFITLYRLGFNHKMMHFDHFQAPECCSNSFISWPSKEEMGLICLNTISNCKMAKSHDQNIFKDLFYKNIRYKVISNNNHCLIDNHDNFSKDLDLINFSDSIQNIPNLKD